jgi:hypothetical protein
MSVGEPVRWWDSRHLRESLADVLLIRVGVEEPIDR